MSVLSGVELSRVGAAASSCCRPRAIHVNEPLPAPCCRPAHWAAAAARRPRQQHLGGTSRERAEFDSVQLCSLSMQTPLDPASFLSPRHSALGPHHPSPLSLSSLYSRLASYAWLTPCAAANVEDADSRAAQGSVGWLVDGGGQQAYVYDSQLALPKSTPGNLRNSRAGSGSHLHHRQQLRPPAAGRQRREHKLKALGAVAGEEVEGRHIACILLCKERWLRSACLDRHGFMVVSR